MLKFGLAKKLEKLSVFFRFNLNLFFKLRHQIPCPHITDPAEKYLSLIVPAFNEEQRLPAALEETMEWVKLRSLLYIRPFFGIVYLLPFLRSLLLLQNSSTCLIYAYYWGIIVIYLWFCSYLQDRASRDKSFSFEVYSFPLFFLISFKLIKVDF